MEQDFWNLINEYRQIGFEPLRFLGNLNQINSKLFFSQYDLKKTNIKITPKWYDFFHKNEGKSIEVTRRIYPDLINPKSHIEIDSKKACVIFNISENLSDLNKTTGIDIVQNFLNDFPTKCAVNRIITNKANENNQFVLMDFIKSQRGTKVGYNCINNFILNITDIRQPLDSEIHSNINFTGALENLLLLGCTSEFQLFPAYDAPNEDTLDTMRKNFDNFALKYNLVVVDFSSLKKGRWFYASTATAKTDNELPLKYDELTEDMEIILSDKFGTLLPIHMYYFSKIDDQNISILEKNGIEYNDLCQLNDKVFNKMNEPKFSFGKIISKYCPKYGNNFSKTSNIYAVFPVMESGIYAMKELAEYTNSEIIINKIPIKYEELRRFAINEFIVENTTSSINGCHFIIAHKDVTNLILEDLKKINLEPQIIGKIGKRGEPKITLVNENINNYTLSKNKLRIFRANKVIADKQDH